MDIYVDRIALTPTAAEVVWFTARRVARGVELRWRASTEARIVAFEIWRCAARGDGLLRIARVLAKAAGTASGASYRHVDRFAPRPGSYLCESSGPTEPRCGRATAPSCAEACELAAVRGRIAATATRR
jgi:hypothetical protein